MHSLRQRRRMTMGNGRPAVAHARPLKAFARSRALVPTFDVGTHLFANAQRGSAYDRRGALTAWRPEPQLALRPSSPPPNSASAGAGAGWFPASSYLRSPRNLRFSVSVWLRLCRAGPFCGHPSSSSALEIRSIVLHIPARRIFRGKPFRHADHSQS